MSSPSAADSAALTAGVDASCRPSERLISSSGPVLTCMLSLLGLAQGLAFSQSCFSEFQNTCRLWKRVSTALM